MNLLWVLFAHYLLDYPLQSDFLATTKGKYFYSLLAHTMIYGLGMSLCLQLLGTLTIWKTLVLLLSHLIIDYWKSHAKNKDKALTTYLYIDQVLHIGIDALLYFI